jgi:hypothetical protein
VLRFDGQGDVLQFTTRLNQGIGAVFFVLKADAAATGRHWLLGDFDSNHIDFYPGSSGLWDGSTSGLIRNGQTWLNGAPVDGMTTGLPATMSVLSVLPTAPVSADRLFGDGYVWWNWPWQGDIAELVIYDHVLTAAQRKGVEDYLALKYALGAAYRGAVSAPGISPNGGRFTGTVTVALSAATPGAEIRYTTDGSDPDSSSSLYDQPLTLSASATVKARAYRAGMAASTVSAAAFIEASDFSPSSLPGLALWVRADAGVEADAAGRVNTWRDQSGKANDLVQGVLAGQPVLVADAPNGPVLRFDGQNDVLQFTTRLDRSIGTAFLVLDGDAGPAQRWLLGDVDTSHIDFFPGNGTLWRSDASPAVRNGETWLNRARVDGTTTPRPATLSVLAVVPTSPVSADRLGAHAYPYWGVPWLGDIAELVIYDHALSPAERDEIEDYFVFKYGIASGAVAAPEISPNGGRFSGSVRVSMEQQTPGAEIRYTTDGSDPTPASTLYIRPFSLTASTTLKAQAFLAGTTPSAITTARFERMGEFSPASVPGLALWVRADIGVEADVDGRVSAWRDQSGKGNDLVQEAPSPQPLLVPDAQNGLPALRFDGQDDFMQFTTRLDHGIGTAFFVLNSDSVPGPRWLLGDIDTSHLDFYPGGSTLWRSDTSTLILNGQTWLNGAPVDGTMTARPAAMAVLEVAPTAPVSADRLFNHAYSGWSWPWQGEIAELAIYDHALSSMERKAIADSLALKYGLAASYQGTTGAPAVSPNGGRFTGSVAVTLTSATPGAQIRYTIDGSDPGPSSSLYAQPFTLTSSATVKARAYSAGLPASAISAATLIEANDFSPAAVAGLALWVRADAGVEPDASGRVDIWRDQSGKANDLTQSALGQKPMLVADAQNGLPVLRFNGYNFLQFTTRLDRSIGTAFLVLDGDAGQAQRWLLGDVDTSHIDFFPGNGTLWRSDASPAVRNGETWLNRARVDGTTTPRPATLSVLAVVPTSPVSADRLGAHAYPYWGVPWLGDVAEMVIYDHALSPAERDTVEDYLVFKYGILSDAVTPPDIAPEGGPFTDSVRVTLEQQTPGAEIRYTTDGSDPTPTSTLYVGPFDLTASTTVKAQAFRAGLTPSAITTARFERAGDFSLASVPGLALWVRADVGVEADAAGHVSAWRDQSGKGNDLVQEAPSPQPLLAPDAQNGLPALRFDGQDDFMQFTTRLDHGIGTAFFVLNSDSAPGPRWLLGDIDSSHLDFYPGVPALWRSPSTSALILNGQTWLNGAPVDGTTTARPAAMAVLEVAPTAPVSADRLFSHAYGPWSWPWQGEIAELAIYDHALSSMERKAIADSLALKYGLAGSYQGTTGAPAVSPNGGRFTGSVAVTLTSATPGAQIRYTIDGSDPGPSSSLYAQPFTLTSSATVKARAYSAGLPASAISAATLIEANDFTPAAVAGLALWVRADAGVEPDASGRVGAWRDQSGKANDLTQSASGQQPMLVADAQNGLPALHFDGQSDFLQFTTRLDRSIGTAFLVLKGDAGPAQRWLLGDNNTTYDFFPGNGTLWRSDASPAVRNGETWLNRTRVDGTTTPRPATLSVLAVVPTSPVTADRLGAYPYPYWGQPWLGDVTEMVIYDHALSPAERSEIESYLAARYGLTLAP